MSRPLTIREQIACPLYRCRRMTKAEYAALLKRSQYWTPAQLSQKLSVRFVETRGNDAWRALACAE